MVNTALSLNDCPISIHSLVWLDISVNKSPDNIETQQRLVNIIHPLEIFDDASKCQVYLQSVSPQDRVVLIISGQLGRLFVPRVHQLQQVCAIYVFCMNSARNQKWPKQFHKVGS